MKRKTAKKNLMALGFSRNDAEYLLRGKVPPVTNSDVFWAGVRLFLNAEGNVGRVSPDFTIRMEE